MATGKKTVWDRVNTAVTVEPATFLYFFAYGLKRVTWQDLIYDKICLKAHNLTDCHNKDWQDTQPALQSESSAWILYANIALVLPMMVTLSLLSGYSDRYGLRLAFLLPLVGATLSYLLLAALAYFPDWHVSVILPASLLSGMTGDYSTVLMATMSYISLVTSTKNMTLHLSLVEGLLQLAIMAASFVSGPIVAASDEYGLAIVYVLAAGLNFFAFLDVTFRLRQPPLPAPADKHDSLVKIIWDSLKEYFRVVFRPRPFWQRTCLQLIAAVFTLTAFAVGSTQDLLFLFFTKEIGKTLTDYTMYSGLTHCIGFFGNTVGLWLLMRVFRFNERDVIVAGVTVTTTAYAFISYSRNDYIYYSSIILQIFRSLPHVGCRAYMAKHVAASEVAAALGYLATLQSITPLFASAAFNSLYPLTLSWWPGFLFVAAAFLCLLCVPILTGIAVLENKSSEQGSINMMSE